MSEMITFTLDGNTITVPKGTTVHTAARKHGIEIPVFCYEEHMPPFGACRVCLVEVEKMPKLQTSCTLEATEGMVVNSQTSKAVDGRAGILEFLLINHPLDCPVCDRGGECPLQDQTVKFGPGESRFFEEKRHFQKPKALGPVLMLDRERCIICARCTRFSDTISGDNALEFIERGYKTEVGTPNDKPVDSKFIGNTIMLCPVGALTSQVYRFRARPWDNDHTPSTCTLCPVGCSMTLDSRDGEIMRTRSCKNEQVNDIWLCDKGWFGYEFTSNPDRLQKPLIRRNGKLEPASWDDALSLIATKIKEAKPNGKLAAFGGNPLTTEENYLFQKLFRDVLGVNHVDHRIGMPALSLEEEGFAPGMEIAIGECEQLSYAVVLGVDLTEEFPVIWLRLNQGINHGAKVLFCGHYTPETAQHLSKIVVHAPGSEMEVLKQQFSEISALWQDGKKGAIFIGSQYLNGPNRLEILAELVQWKTKLPNLSLNILEGNGNSGGARLAGMRPDFGPNETKLNQPGLNASQVLEKASKDGWDVLYVAGADPVAKFPAKLWNEARAKLGFLVVQDMFLTATAQQADVVLPVLSFIEKQGSMINIEGRVQKLKPGKMIPTGLYSDGEIFKLLALKSNSILSVDADFEAKLESAAIIAKPKNAQLKATGKSHITKSAGLLATFAPVLFDRGVRMRHNPHVSKLVEEPRIRINPQEAAKHGIKENDDVSIAANGNAIKVKVKLDKGVADRTVVVPMGFNELPVYELGPLLSGMEVNIKKY